LAIVAQKGPDAKVVLARKAFVPPTLSGRIPKAKEAAAEFIERYPIAEKLGVSFVQIVVQTPKSAKKHNF
jgi:hypothetical protein